MSHVGTRPRGPSIAVLTGLCLLALTACRAPEERRAAPIEISAVDLHKAYAADAQAAARRFEGKPLIVTGEVKIAKPAFMGRTMSRTVTVPAQVYFKTEVDNLPTDIKYVVCEGDFADRASTNPWVLNPKIKVGETLSIRCDPAKIKWSDPGLYVSNCALVSP